MLFCIVLDVHFRSIDEDHSSTARRTNWLSGDRIVLLRIGHEYTAATDKKTKGHTSSPSTREPRVKDEENGTTRDRPCRRVFESATPSMVENVAVVTRRPGVSEDGTWHGISGSNLGD
jgi:hypothetical protein